MDLSVIFGERIKDRILLRYGLGQARFQYGITGWPGFQGLRALFSCFVALGVKIDQRKPAVRCVYPLVDPYFLLLQFENARNSFSPV